MEGQARVGSIDAIQDFRAALIRYAERARRALDDVTGEVKRTRGWLESEQRQKWFLAGYTGGPNACNSFDVSAGQL